jgi:hypothetical protein
MAMRLILYVLDFILDVSSEAIPGQLTQKMGPLINNTGQPIKLHALSAWLRSRPETRMLMDPPLAA